MDLSEAKQLAEFQFLFLELTKENMKATIQQLLEFEFSKSIKVFMRHLLIISDIRRNKTDIYVQLVKELIENHSQETDYSKIKEFLLNHILHPFSPIFHYLNFIHRCMDMEILTMQEVVSTIRTFFEGKHNFANWNCSLFVWFAYEIHELDLDLYQRMKASYEEDLFNQTMENPAFWPRIRDEEEDLIFMRDSARECCPAYPHLIFIKYDDVDQLQFYSSHSTDFSFNQRIRPSIYYQAHILELCQNLMQFAAFYGSIKCFRYIMMNQMTDSKYSLASFAVAGGNIEIIRLVEQIGYNFNNCLEEAVNYFRFDILEWLVQFKDSNSIQDIFISATSAGNFRELINCLENDVDVNYVRHYSYPIPAIHYAAMRCHIEIIKLLLRHPSLNVNKTDNAGENALLLAAQNNDPESFMIFYEDERVDKDKTTNSGWTVVHMATAAGCFDMIELFLKIGMNMNVCDKLSYYPIHFAAEKNYSDIITMLINCETVDVNILTQSRKTPLMIAIEFAANDAIKELVSCDRVYINRLACDIEAPIFLALLYNNKRAVECFLSRNDLDLSAISLNGNNILDEASILDDPDIINMIEQKINK